MHNFAVLLPCLAVPGLFRVTQITSVPRLQPHSTIPSAQISCTGARLDSQAFAVGQREALSTVCTRGLHTARVHKRMHCRQGDGMSCHGELARRRA